MLLLCLQDHALTSQALSFVPSSARKKPVCLLWNAREDETCINNAKRQSWSRSHEPGFAPGPSAQQQPCFGGIVILFYPGTATPKESRNSIAKVGFGLLHGATVRLPLSPQPHSSMIDVSAHHEAESREFTPYKPFPLWISRPARNSIFKQTYSREHSQRLYCLCHSY